MKIFDQAAARTGLRDHEARAAGFDPVTIGSEADDHKAYYPGSHRIHMRFTGDRATGRLLGVQLFGHKDAEIAKRVDIAAAAIFHGMTVDEVSDLDLSYTPPLGSPWDAVQAGAQAWTRQARYSEIDPANVTERTATMPHLLLHPHSRSPRRRAAVTAAVAVLAAGAVALAGCTSAAPSTPAATVAAAAVEITGAGSTFDAPFFTAAFAAYQQAHPGVAVSYAAVGSSAGITRFAAGQVGLRRHRRPRQPSRPGRRQRRDAAGAGRPRRRGRRLQRPHQRQRAAAADRPGDRPDLPRPDHQVGRPRHQGPQPRHRAARRLHQRRAPLRRQRHHLHLQQLPLRGQPRLGLGRRHRPVPALARRHRRRRQRRRGRATIGRIPYSIGYTERSYVTGTAAVGSAAVQNQAGNYVHPTAAAITADAAGKPAITPDNFSIVNEPGPASYPICGYSWVLLSARQPTMADAAPPRPRRPVSPAARTRL